jgi:hypothetical protein
MKGAVTFTESICQALSRGDGEEGGLGEVALVHALLNGNWVPHLEGCGLSVHMHIEGYPNGKCTLAGLQAQSGHWHHSP